MTRTLTFILAGILTLGLSVGALAMGGHGGMMGGGRGGGWGGTMMQSGSQMGNYQGYGANYGNRGYGPNYNRQGNGRPLERGWNQTHGSTYGAQPDYRQAPKAPRGPSDNLSR